MIKYDLSNELAKQYADICEEIEDLNVKNLKRDIEYGELQRALCATAGMRNRYRRALGDIQQLCKDASRCPTCNNSIARGMNDIAEEALKEGKDDR